MATKIDIISGFLGAGKTTLIKKLLKEAYADEQVVLIENEFGEIGIDGGFLKEAGIQIREMNSGCICCSLVGDFGTSLKEVVDKYHPDRILIEPSGVGKLSDVIKAVQGVQGDVDIVLNSYTTVVDAKKCKMYMRNFGEFFDNQVEYAGAIIMSRTDIIDEKKAQQAMELLRGINAKAAIITTPIEKLDGKKILEVMEKPVSLEEELMSEEEVCPECGHVHEHGEHHHHDHDHHHHHHHDDEGEAEEYGIGTFVYYSRKPFDLGLFDDFVARKWPRDVVRAKGICYFADERDMCYVFEQAGRQKTVKQAGQWIATMPKDQLDELLAREEQLRKEWDDKVGDRMIKIVFIGQHLQKEAICKELDKCLVD